MRFTAPIALALLATALAGCHDSTAPGDVIPPAAPRGLYSVTGDRAVTLHWLANTESDVAGYRIYEAPCASGTGCPYDRVGATSATAFTVGGLANGVTRYFAVAAVDQAGNESALSAETVFDTPRPAGSGATLANYENTPALSAWTFAGAAVRAATDSTADVVYDYKNNFAEIFVENGTVIQDFGYAASLDAVDWAPTLGYAPSGTVEAIPGHCYVVWTADDHFAKFQVTSVSATQVVFDWAYQVAAGNPELHPKPAGGTAALQPARPGR